MLHIIGGVCLLLWGVGMVSKGLNRAFGAPLRRVISHSTSNRFKAFGVGVFVTMLLQSSTATSLIVSSFAARNIITISGAIAVILGADVGTTIAAQILSFDLKWLFPILIAAGFIVNKSIESSQYKHIGSTLIGLSLILLSLQLISTAAAPLKESAVLQAMVTPLRDQSILAVSLAALLTWLAHSSLGMVLLFMSFTATGAIPLELGFYLTLGANIGGAIAPVVMTLRDIPAGRRVPLGNLVMRSIGVLFFLPFMEPLVIPFIESMDSTPARMIVNFHTGFNIIVAMAFLPFIGPMTRLSEILLPDRPREEDDNLPRYLDPTAFDTPPAALACVARETMRISDVIEKMLRQTLEAFRTNNPRLVQDIRDGEAVADSLYEAVKNYLTRINAESLDATEQRRYMQILTFSTNLEHVGDIIDKSLMELATKKLRNQDNFSRAGFAEISTLHGLVMDSLSLAQNVFMTGDVGMARKLFNDKTRLREQEIQASESHFKRLSEGVAETIATSSLHLDILRDLRRINSYISLIAYPILENAKELEPTRLKPVKTVKTKAKRAYRKHKAKKERDKKDLT